MGDGSTRRPLVVLANRLPVKRRNGGWIPSDGGLTTALRPVLDEVGGAWVGWDDGVDDIPRRVDGLAIDLHTVRLSRADAQGYYHGFANRTLWPLFHDLVVEPIIDRRWWNSYVEANEQFCATSAEVATSAPPLLWVHDYHLLLAPQQLRALHPDSPIGFFLHIPFPPPELFARLPWRNELLEGMLGADAVTFHTTRYRDNFLRSVARVLPDIGVDEHILHLPEGRDVFASARPISVDAAAFDAAAVDPATETEVADLRTQFAGRRVFLGVDRLDYTKGIRHRLQAIELLLERRPALRRTVAFVQIAVPSRGAVKEYQNLREQVETEVGRINGRFTEPGADVPVHYLYRGLPRTSLAAYYRLADVLCVTPLKDGMNLVAKEFVVTQDAGNEAGVLLLSEFAGAAEEFARDALLCNPFDVEGLSLRMEAALELDPVERRARLRRMADHVRGATVFDWVTLTLSDVVEHARPA